MLNKLITKVVGSRNDRLVRKMGKIVGKTNDLEESGKARSREERKALSTKLRERHAGG